MSPKPHSLLAFRQSSHAAIIVAADGPTWTIIDANDAYVAVTHHPREQLIGFGTFEAFPESTATTRDDGAANVRLSFEQAIATRGRFVLPIQRYDIRVPNAPSGFEEHYWEMSSVPLCTEDGTIAGVLHEVENVTDRVRNAAERTRLTNELSDRNDELEKQEIELTLSNERLQDNAAELEAQAEELQTTAAQLQERTAEAETARATAERTEARMAEIFRQAPAFIAVLRDRDFVFEFANDAYHQLVGHRSILGKRLLDALPEVGQQGFIDQLNAVMDSGTAYVGNEVSLTLVPVEGGAPEERVVTFVYAPVRDVDGSISGVFVHGVDVTSLARARQEIATSEQRTRTLQMLTGALAGARTLDDVSDVIVTQIVAATGAVSGMVALLDDTRTAATMIRHTGFPAAELQRYSTMSLATYRGPSADVLRTGEPVFVDHRDGPDGLFERYPVQRETFVAMGSHALASLPLRIGDRTFGAMSFTFDVPLDGHEHRPFLLTLAQQASQALERAQLFLAEQQARAAAEEANTAKMTFLATMSHELRTPLNALGGFLELLLLELRGPITPAQRDDLERMQRSHSHLLNLINDILNYAKIDIGHAQYDITTVRAGDVLRHIEDIVSAQCRAKELSCELQIPDPQPLVRADEERLGQILLNLLSNAIKYTPRGGQLTVWLDQENTRVSIHVRDTGMGIPADKLSAIFDPFMQVGRRHNSPGEGVGLGLAISKDLAIGMNGSLTVDSAVGEGSTFTLTLPAA